MVLCTQLTCSFLFFSGYGWFRASSFFRSICTIRQQLFLLMLHLQLSSHFFFVSSNSCFHLTKIDIHLQVILKDDQHLTSALIFSSHSGAPDSPKSLRHIFSGAGQGKHFQNKCWCTFIQSQSPCDFVCLGNPLQFLTQLEGKFHVFRRLRRDEEK